MLVHRNDKPFIASDLRATIVWMTEKPLTTGQQYSFKVGVTESTGVFSKINHQIDINTLAEKEVDQLGLNEIGVCEVSLNKPMVFDAYENNRSTGAFIVIDRLTNVTVGAGMIVEEVSASKTEGLSEQTISDFELEFNALVRKHFPHWDAKDISKLL